MRDRDVKSRAGTESAHRNRREKRVLLNLRRASGNCNEARKGTRIGDCWNITRCTGDQDVYLGEWREEDIRSWGREWSWSIKCFFQADTIRGNAGGSNNGYEPQSVRILERGPDREATHLISQERMNKNRKDEKNQMNMKDWRSQRNKTQSGGTTRSGRSRSTYLIEMVRYCTNGYLRWDAWN